MTFRREARGSPHRPERTGDVREDVHRIVTQEDYGLLVDRAEKWGSDLAGKLRMAQIRRIFGEVKRLQMRWEPRRLRMLRPRLAYVAARAGQGGAQLRDILTPAIEEVFKAPSDDQIKRFHVVADLFEAILAHFTAKERRQGGRGE